MNSKNYSKLGVAARRYAKSESFTDYDLGKAIEQLYLMIRDEDMRDARDEANGKIGASK